MQDHVRCPIYFFSSPELIFHSVDAAIAFGGQGLTVNWAGQTLGHIAMEPLKVAADVGASLDTAAVFTVANVDHLTAFTKVCTSWTLFAAVVHIPSDSPHRGKL
jgi:hypothetical protein